MFREIQPHTAVLRRQERVKQAIFREDFDRVLREGRCFIQLGRPGRNFPGGDPADGF